MLGHHVCDKNNTPYSTVLLIQSFVFYCRSSYDNLNAYMLRSMIGQALLQTIGGSTKFSVSKLDATRLYNIKIFKFPNWYCEKTYKRINVTITGLNIIFSQSENAIDVLKEQNFQELSQYLQDWDCQEPTILKCYQILINRLIHQGLIAEESHQIAGT